MSTSPSGTSDAGQNLLQNSSYVGINIENILYGMELLLYFKTIRILLSNGGVRKKTNLYYALFSTIMVCSVTIWVSTSAIFGQEMWLIDSNYPGGPNAFFEANISIWYMDWGTTTVILLQLMTDALMIYRCLIIWNNYRVIVIPIFLWLCTLVLGILVDWTSSSPGGNFFSGVSSQLALAYYSVSVFLNTMLTCMICYRILRHGGRVRENLGYEHATLYFGIAALVIESVLPYTLCGIAVLVSFGMGSETSVAFMSVYVLMMSISPQMLILRVADGRAWNRDTSKSISTLRFNPGGTSMLEQMDGNETRVQLQTLSKTHLPDKHGKVVISSV